MIDFVKKVVFYCKICKNIGDLLSKRPNNPFQTLTKQGKLVGLLS